MATCKTCGKTGWMLRTDKRGVCRTCDETIRRTVESRLAALKEKLVYIRCSRDPNAVLSHCDAAIRDAEELLDFEKRRLYEITPKPSALLDMLQARRQETLAALRPARADVGSEAGPDAAARPALGNPEPLRIEQQEHQEERDWWAWEFLDEDAFEFDPRALVAASAENRRAERERVHCFVFLEPGGIRATVENLSAGGLFLHATRLRPPGSRVRLLISTTHGPLGAEGVVRWVQKAGDGAGASSGMGIEFTQCSAELQRYLDLRFAAPPPPPAPPGPGTRPHAP